MKQRISQHFPSCTRRMRSSAMTWVRSFHRTALVILLIILPASLWSFPALQKAQASLAQPGPFATTGTRLARVGNMVFIILVNLAATCVGASCIISGMEAARAQKPKWLGRGIRKALRLLGWTLIVTIQTPVRAFLPFLPPPAGADPESYRPPEKSLAAWIERIPILSGFSFYLSKFGLLAYAAVLKPGRWTDSASLTRGHYLHVGILNLILGVIGLISFGFLSNAQAAAPYGSAAPPVFLMGKIIVLDQLVGSLLTAYGLHLFRDCEAASAV